MNEWVRIEESLPRRGQDVWLYDSMFGTVTAWTIMCDPRDIDADFSHWQPRDCGVKPSPPVDGKVHARMQS